MRNALATLSITVALASGCAPGSSASSSTNSNGGEETATPAATPDTRVDVIADAPRPLDVMPVERLAQIAPRLPRVADDALRALLESEDTLWYDRHSIIPGYQDSFGQDYDCSTCGPTGMRPNSIAANMINLAVPGGHAQIFAERGRFHFPFGRVPGDGAPTAIVNFWNVPRDADGDLLPVVWWRRDPNAYTHRWEWMFPAGTTLGEILFILDGGEWFPFEIRTRERTLEGWTNDVFRPFPRADDFADALEAKREQDAGWASAADVQALIDHARDPATLTAGSLSATNFPGAFPTLNGWKDVLPAIDDTTILKELLLETPFRSAKEIAWKTNGTKRTWAATTNAWFSVVPAQYDGGFLHVDDATCNKCHRDAGRPFRDWYSNILAYGELWGEDASFTWHPFENDEFVNANGDAVNFNWGSRVIRSDMTEAGLLTPYVPSSHPATVYKKIPGDWKNYSY